MSSADIIMQQAEREMDQMQREIDRLRDAVLWASTLKPLNDYELEYEWSISDELLQRSNMSHLKPSRRVREGVMPEDAERKFYREVEIAKRWFDSRPNCEHLITPGWVDIILWANNKIAELRRRAGGAS